ncbi:MAG: FAD-binding oxidoreductase [Pseudomonadota bacterium]|nr:FAD-binding oxidoreductase [Pseudomonadota bacterium]
MADILPKLEKKFDSSTLLIKDQDMAKYVTDWPKQLTGKATAVIRPKTTAEVSEIMKIAYDTATPVVPQSGNTSVAGGSIPDKNGKAIVLSLERMNKVRDISSSAMTATVEAGVILENLHKIVEEKGLFFPLNFGAKGSCMIGGNLATNAGGQNVVRYGNTRDLCLGIEAVTSQGQIVNLLSGLRKDNTGYDLRDLFIGSEGTLGIITAATLKLFHLPNARATTFAVVPDITRGLDLLNLAQSETGGTVEAFELIPDVFLQLVRDHAPQHNIPFENIPSLCVLIEIAETANNSNRPNEDSSAIVNSKLEKILEAGFELGLVLDAVVANSEAQRRNMWEMREGALEVITAAGTRIGFDISLPLNKIQEFIEEMKSQTEEIMSGLRMCHMGHLGDGNLHYSIFPPKDELKKFLDKSEKIKSVVYDSIGKYGGSFSAEHGIGTSKLLAMSKYKDPVSLTIMKQIKKTLDPKNIMNPGKLLP